MIGNLLCSRPILGILIILSGMVFTGTKVVAQSCGCLPGATEQSRVVPVCLYGQSLQAMVEYCIEQNCPAPSATNDPCNPGLSITARVYVKSVCMVSPIPPGFTYAGQHLLLAAIQSMGYCCSDHADVFGCSAPQAAYYWVVRWPSCTFMTGASCVVACNDSPCCGFLVKFEPNVPGIGDCTTTVVGTCSDVDGCEYPLGCCVNI